MNGISKSVFLLLLLILFPVVGGGLLFSTWGQLTSAKLAKDWPSVQGEILSSEVVKETVTIIGQGQSSGRHAAEVYRVQTRYVYHVDGKQYAGDRITFAEAITSDRYQIELTAKQFQKGPTTVYYNPQSPQEAVLAPQDVGGIYPGFVFGALLMVVPTGLIIMGLRHEWIERPELPLPVRIAWQRVFGPSGATFDVQLAPSTPKAETVGEQSDGESQLTPPDADFVETINRWEPGIRIELNHRPPSILAYVLLASVAGVIADWIGMLPITQLIFGRDTPHVPELRSVAVTLFAMASGSVFVVLRFLDRGSSAIIDWDQGWVTAKREFSPRRSASIRDVRRVVVRCLPVEGRRRKYRATIEIDLPGANLTIARTCEPRRKPESAWQKAAQLADPLAEALNVPVELAGWED